MLNLKAMTSASSMSTLWIWRSLKAHMYALESTGSWSGFCKRKPSKTFGTGLLRRGSSG